MKHLKPFIFPVAILAVCVIQVSKTTPSGYLKLSKSDLLAKARATSELTWEDMHEREDLSWDDITEMLNMLDDAVLNEAHQGMTHDENENIVHFIWAFLDNYDLTGDPDFDFLPDGNGTLHSVQVDDCNGQPNAC